MGKTAGRAATKRTGRRSNISRPFRGWHVRRAGGDSPICLRRRARPGDRRRCEGSGARPRRRRACGIRSRRKDVFGAPALSDHSWRARDHDDIAGHVYIVTSSVARPLRQRRSTWSDFLPHWKRRRHLVGSGVSAGQRHDSRKEQSGILSELHWAARERARLLGRVFPWGARIDLFVFREGTAAVGGAAGRDRTDRCAVHFLAAIGSDAAAGNRVPAFATRVRGHAWRSVSVSARVAGGRSGGLPAISPGAFAQARDARESETARTLPRRFLPIRLAGGPASGYTFPLRASDAQYESQ